MNSLLDIFNVIWHRGVCLAAARCARRSQAHAAKRQQEQNGKTKPKVRRSGAVPAEPLRRRLPLLLPRNAFSLLVFAVRCTS